MAIESTNLGLALYRLLTCYIPSSWYSLAQYGFLLLQQKTIMRKYATYFMFILMLVSFSATAQLSIKKDKSENEGESKTSAFAEKMKAKAKNFNPMKSIGKLAGNLLTSTTDDLSAVSMRVIYADNLYPSEAGTIETEY
ncbi:MAG: hypothetical protein ACI9DM_002414, partial [Cyclobacteriaceae bacterium]